MLHLLGILFFFILAILFAVLLIGLNVINAFIRLVLGRNNKRSAYGNHTTGSRQSTNQMTGESTLTDTVPKRKKIFDSDEGEYVDFEEIKE